MSDLARRAGAFRVAVSHALDGRSGRFVRGLHAEPALVTRGGTTPPGR
ncbi:hypothetical protein ABGB18_36835 [Nonomuraea sp. B12E4]